MTLLVGLLVVVMLARRSMTSPLPVTFEAYKLGPGDKSVIWGSATYLQAWNVSRHTVEVVLPPHIRRPNVAPIARAVFVIAMGFSPLPRILDEL